MDGGEGGIRTPGTLARTPHFECGAIDHSATSPRGQPARRGHGRRRNSIRSPMCTSLPSHKPPNAQVSQRTSRAAPRAARRRDAPRASLDSHVSTRKPRLASAAVRATRRAPFQPALATCTKTCVSSAVRVAVKVVSRARFRRMRGAVASRIAGRQRAVPKPALSGGAALPLSLAELAKGAARAHCWRDASARFASIAREVLSTRLWRLSPDWRVRATVARIEAD